MCDIESVEVLDSVHDLIEDSSGCPFLETNLIGHNSEELALFCKLRDYIDVFGGFNDLVEIYDVGVTNFLHDLDFSLDPNFVVFVFNGLFIDYFDGYFLAGRNMDCFFDFAEGAFAEGLSHFVVADAGGSGSGVGKGLRIGFGSDFIGRVGEFHYLLVIKCIAICPSTLKSTKYQRIQAIIYLYANFDLF